MPKTDMSSQWVYTYRFIRSKAGRTQPSGSGKICLKEKKNPGFPVLISKLGWAKQFLPRYSV